jgi:hypothetical protein
MWPMKKTSTMVHDQFLLIFHVKEGSNRFFLPAIIKFTECVVLSDDRSAFFHLKEALSRSIGIAPSKGSWSH